jgi:hypothetical protein
MTKLTIHTGHEEALSELFVFAKPLRTVNLRRFKWLDAWKGRQVVHINFWWGSDIESGHFEDIRK